MAFEHNLEQVVPGHYRVTEECRGGIYLSQKGTARCIALMLDGRSQDQKAEFHSSVLSTGDIVHSFCHIGSSRKDNKDRTLVYPDHSLVLVSDGHGDLGAEISDLLVSYSLQHAPDFHQITHATEEYLNKKTHNTPIRSGAAFAMMKICVDDQHRKHLEYCYRGDAGVVVLHKVYIGRCVQHRTKDQTLGEEYRDRRIPSALAARCDNVVTNSISSANDEDCDTAAGLRLVRGDRVLVGCDGALKHHSSEELRKNSHGKSSQEFLQWLFESGYAEGDNISAAVIDIA